jgi:signal transduction histidine kinase
VTHTHQVIEMNGAVLARVVDAETGERGYIITGDTAFLDPYRGAEQDAIAHIDDLRRLTADNAAQQARIDTLAGLVSRRFTVLDTRIRTRRERGFERVQTDFAVNGGGKAVMDSARNPRHVDLLETGVHGPMRSEQENDIRRIKRSAGHLRALITEVLNFAKIEAGQLQLAIEDVRMDSVLGELRPIVEPQVAAKGLTLRTSCPPDLIVRADREKVDQILVNLAANAIKFTNGGGSVAIECHSDGASVRTEVRDTGIGIPTDQLDAIFVPFVQLEASVHRGNDRGVGLGLAISRQLARAMRGDVTVESVVGGGSTFTLRLPRAPRLT